MSHKAVLKTKINNKESLLQTLDILGITYQVAEKTNALQITSRFNVKADVDILLLKDAKGMNINAVGFTQNTDGSFEATGDFYEISGAVTKDNERLNEDHFKDVITKRYMYIQAVKQMTQIGLTVSQDVSNFKNEELNFVMSSQF